MRRMNTIILTMMPARVDTGRGSSTPGVGVDDDDIGMDVLVMAIQLQLDKVYANSLH
jgi:hypothetical protein